MGGRRVLVLGSELAQPNRNLLHHKQICQISAMKHASNSRLLFALEMAFSLFFLLLCFFAIHLPLRIVECSMNHGKLNGVEKLPELTRCLQWCLPEGAAAAILGPIAVAIGFASVASVSGETLSSRLFRWFLIPLGFAKFASIVPLAESHLCLCSSKHDDAWLDEVLFLAVSLALGFVGLRHAHKRSPTPGSDVVPEDD